MISYEAFYDELAKLAAEENDNYVTKERLKRLAIAIPVAGAGMFAGHFAGRALAHELAKHQGPIADFARAHPTLTKGIPPALMGLAGLTAALRSRKIKKYVHGDETSRPE